MPVEHATGDRLEEYCLGRVPAAEQESLENHLLVCPACQELLRETDYYVRTMRQAAAELAREMPARNKNPLRRWFGPLFRPVPAAAFAGIAALALVWAIGPAFQGRRAQNPVAVTLEATRGGDENLRVHAPQRTPLTLKLDLTGVAPLEVYEVRIVDADGAPVLESSARPQGGHLLLNAPARLARGTYWVRLYNRAERRMPLREYGLELD
jgi:hypothetical protein